jgi:hypothetical protein
LTKDEFGMSHREIKKYLPTATTVRRVMDRAASDENMRRALENPRLREAMTETPAAPSPGQGGEATAVVAPCAADRAGDEPLGARTEPATAVPGARRGKRRWTPLRVAAVAIASSLVPALLVYVLLVRPAELRLAELQRTQASADAGAAPPGVSPEAGEPSARPAIAPAAEDQDAAAAGAGEPDAAAAARVEWTAPVPASSPSPSPLTAPSPSTPRVVPSAPRAFPVLSPGTRRPPARTPPAPRVDDEEGGPLGGPPTY